MPILHHGCQKLTSAMKLRLESDGRLQISCSIQVCLRRKLPEVGGVKTLTEVCIGWWSSMYQPLKNHNIGLQVVEAHLLFQYFLEKRLAIPTSFFIY